MASCRTGHGKGCVALARRGPLRSPGQALSCRPGSMTKASPRDAEISVAVASPPSGAAPPSAPVEPVVTASHDVLFESIELKNCDACGSPLAEAADDDGFGIRGRGVYMWTRGDSVRFDEAPL